MENERAEAEATELTIFGKPWYKNFKNIYNKLINNWVFALLVDLADLF